MSSLFVLVPMGIVFTAIAIGFLVWAVNSDQFEHLKDIGSRLPDDD